VFKIDEDIPFINQPWGFERIFAENEHYVGKYTFIEAGHRMSRHYHQRKEKTIYVLSGSLHLEIGPDDESPEIVTLGMVEGESYHVDPEIVHRLCAPDTNDVEIIEVGTNDPQDIVRLEDDYGRLPAGEA
jgi:mannose-6-phosphate isomerase|tara:strand:+ start:155 stop:544 length:390 start_codon:yes stop_codon:yes gene_type:complete